MASGQVPDASEAAPGSPRVRVVGHPLVAHRLAELRERTTDSAAFRRLVGETSALLAYEALHDLATTPRLVETPVSDKAESLCLGETVLLVPVLRAGLGMVPAISALVPLVEVAHVGLRRDERTLEATVYLDALPADLSGRRVVVCDPMLATGGSMCTVCDMLVARGASDISAICLIAAEAGVAELQRRHPAVSVTCAALDPVLDARGFIVPGLGDAGDRLFGLAPEVSPLR